MKQQFPLEELSLEINKEFERIYKTLDDTPFISRGLISYYDVLKAHFVLANYFINEGEKVNYGVKDINILGSALGRQITGSGTYSKWNTSEEICATLFYGLVKNHAFFDVNKRTSLLTLFYQLYKFKRVPNVKLKEFEKLAIDVASDNLESYTNFKKFKNKSFNVQDQRVLCIADFIHSKTRIIDKRIYILSCRELMRLLKKQGFIVELNEQNISILKKERKGWFQKKEKHTKVMSLPLGNKGIRSEISKKMMKEILKNCNLTEKDGVDSKAFYEEEESLVSLIDRYYLPLKRLKDK